MARAAFARLNKRSPYGWLALLATAAIFLLAFYLSQPVLFRSCGMVFAEDSPADYCYRITVTVTNTGADKTNYPVAVTWSNSSDASSFDAPGLISQSYLGNQQWDLFPTTQALTEIEHEDHDISAASGNRLWLIAPTLTGSSATTTLYLYMGDNSSLADYGVYYDGTTDTVTRAHEAALEPTNNFRMRTRAQVSATHETAGWFVTKWAANLGYRLGTIDIDGTKYARCQADATTLDVAWDGSDAFLQCDYQDPTLTVQVLDTEGTVTASNTAAIGGAIGQAGAGTSFSSGDSLTGYVKEVELQLTINVTPTRAIRWGFDPDEMTETQKGDAGNAWTFLGTVTDQTANARDGGYSLTRDQSDLSVSLGGVTTNFASQVLTVTQSIADLFGTPTASDLFATPAPSNALPFINALNGAASNSGLPTQTFWFAFLGFLGIILGAIMLPRFGLAWAMLMPTMTIGGGAALSLLSPWWLLVFVLVAVGIYYWDRQHAGAG